MCLYYSSPTMNLLMCVRTIYYIFIYIFFSIYIFAKSKIYIMSLCVVAANHCAILLCITQGVKERSSEPTTDRAMPVLVCRVANWTDTKHMWRNMCPLLVSGRSRTPLFVVLFSRGHNSLVVTGLCPLSLSLSLILSFPPPFSLLSFSFRYVPLLLTPVSRYEPFRQWRGGRESCTNYTNRDNVSRELNGKHFANFEIPNLFRYFFLEILRFDWTAVFV